MLLSSLTLRNSVILPNQLGYTAFVKLTGVGGKMAQKKDQHTVGTPEKPRGQQTGFSGHPDQNREEMDETPAVRGRRPFANKMSADASQRIKN